jgi:hypothetical protein
MAPGDILIKFQFFATYELTPMRYIRLESLASNKHSILLGLFVRYKENEVF